MLSAIVLLCRVHILDNRLTVKRFHVLERGTQTMFPILKPEIEMDKKSKIDSSETYRNVTIEKSVPENPYFVFETKVIHAVIPILKLLPVFVRHFEQNSENTVIASRNRHLEVTTEKSRLENPYIVKKSATHCA